ncbi:MAG: hypothetical protein ACFFG0_01190 [Candidatus Thorarchaeota archaeon]
MAHGTQIAWCKRVKEKYPEFFVNKRILDIGSLDINGNNKGLFENCDYLGLDVIKGKNVDVVSVAHEFKTDKLFDVVLSTNTFEHDMYYKLSIRKMVELLKSGGLMFFCCSSGHREHGTTRTNPWVSGTAQINNKKWASYYKNLTIDDISNVIDFNEYFSDFSLVDKQKDIRFVGLKR